MSVESVAIVLAAGKGTRMKSDLPKVLFPVCGRPMVEYVLDTLAAAGVGKIIAVVGYEADMVREKLGHRDNIVFVEQSPQLGTGHAVMVCEEALADHSGAVAIVAGDSPMLQLESISALLDQYKATRPACILGTLKTEDPTGLGRIVRDESGEFVGIVEHKDATPEQLEINEVNMSTYVFDSQELKSALKKLSNENQQNEYYLTDCPGIMISEQKSVLAMPVLKPIESLSINTPEQLAVVEAEMKK